MPQSTAGSSKWLGLWCFLLGLILLATGLYFVIGGGKLASLGGSWYFVIAGILIVISAVQFFRRKSSAVLIFALVFIGTLIWAVQDAGLDFWQLVSRLMFPAGMFLLALVTFPALRKREGKAPAAKVAYGLSAVMVVGLLATVYGMFQPHPTVAANGQELPLVPVDKSAEQKNWDNYGNTPCGSSFVAGPGPRPPRQRL